MEITRRSLIRFLVAVPVTSILANGGTPASLITDDELKKVPNNNAYNKEMKHVIAGDLDVAYYETGPANGAPVILLHGFPYDAHTYDEAARQLGASGLRCIVPFLRGYGQTRFRSAATFRSGQQAALGADLLALMDALKIQRAVLAGYDWGGRAACVVAALHPGRVAGLVSCGTGYNIQNMSMATAPLSPEKEHLHWYWFYLNSERGKNALTNERNTVCRHLWTTFSPTWKFNDDIFMQTAASFQNPDFVDVVLHSYRYRIGAVPGDPKFNETEDRLSQQPEISVPAIVLMGGADGVDPAEDTDKFANHFSALRDSITLKNIGHDLPQEAPKDFAAAVMRITREGL